MEAEMPREAETMAGGLGAMPAPPGTDSMMFSTPPTTFATTPGRYIRH
jgi:hypothetical protein